MFMNYLNSFRALLHALFDYQASERPWAGVCGVSNEMYLLTNGEIGASSAQYSFRGCASKKTCPVLSPEISSKYFIEQYERLVC